MGGLRRGSSPEWRWPWHAGVQPFRTCPASPGPCVAHGSTRTKESMSVTSWSKCRRLRPFREGVVRAPFMWKLPVPGRCLAKGAFESTTPEQILCVQKHLRHQTAPRLGGSAGHHAWRPTETLFVVRVLESVVTLTLTRSILARRKSLLPYLTVKNRSAIVEHPGYIWMVGA